jgi:hypothetical protein
VVVTYDEGSPVNLYSRVGKIGRDRLSLVALIISRDRDVRNFPSTLKLMDIVVVSSSGEHLITLHNDNNLP